MFFNKLNMSSFQLFCKENLPGFVSQFVSYLGPSCSIEKIHSF